MVEFKQTVINKVGRVAEGTIKPVSAEHKNQTDNLDQISTSDASAHTDPATLAQQLRQQLNIESYGHASRGYQDDISIASTDFLNVARASFAQEPDLDSLFIKFDSLLLQTTQAHDNVLNVLGKLGKLSADNESQLQTNKDKVTDQLSRLFNNYQEYKKPTKDDNAARFNIEMRTEQGDIVKISFKQQQSGFVDDSPLLTGLGMQIQGELSEQEQQAIINLYQHLNEHLNQTWDSISGNFSVDSFDLKNGFDTNVLSGFNVKSYKQNAYSNFDYQIDKVHNSHTMSQSLLVGKEKKVAYSIDVTTALVSAGKRQQALLDKILTHLDKAGHGSLHEGKVNHFLVSSFANMIHSQGVEPSKRSALSAANAQILKRDMQLGGLGLGHFSEVPDYKASMQVAGSNDIGSYRTKLDMSQQSTAQVVGNELQIKQQQEFNIKSHKRVNSESRLGQKVIHWQLSQTIELIANFDADGKLQSHKKKFKEDNMTATQYFNTDYQKEMFKEHHKLEQQTQLKILDNKANWQTQQKQDKQSTLYRLEGFKTYQEVASSRYIREYQQVKQFKFKQ